MEPNKSTSRETYLPNLVLPEEIFSQIEPFRTGIAFFLRLDAYIRGGTGNGDVMYDILPLPENSPFSRISRRDASFLSDVSQDNYQIQSKERVVPFVVGFGIVDKERIEYNELKSLSRLKELFGFDNFLYVGRCPYGQATAERVFLKNDGTLSYQPVFDYSAIYSKSKMPGNFAVNSQDESFLKRIKRSKKNLEIRLKSKYRPILEDGWDTFSELY